MLNFKQIKIISNYSFFSNRMKKYTYIVLGLAMLAGAISLPIQTTAQVFDAVNTGTAADATQGCKIPKDIGELFTMAICTLTKYVIPFLFALALIMFLVGVIKYVKNGDSEEAREAGRGMMLFGIIALFVMTAVWGLVSILYKSFFSTTFEMPSLPPQAPPFK